MVGIKNMEMPESCSKCPFCDQSMVYARCLASAITMGYNFNLAKERLSVCPLFEIEENKNDKKLECE